MTLLLLLLLGPLSMVAEPAAQQPPGWVPQSVEDLGRRAAFHTDFTFDKSMLQVASNFMDNNDDARRAINKLQAISVHSYHFAAPGLYDSAALDRIRTEYAATGWKHMVGAHGGQDPFTPGQTDLHAQTDLWISTSQANVTGMVVLISDAKNFDLIALTGNLSPLDMLHLRGHFGIPKFDGDHLEPAPPSPAPQQ